MELLGKYQREGQPTCSPKEIMKRKHAWETQTAQVFGLDATHQSMIKRIRPWGEKSLPALPEPQSPQPGQKKQKKNSRVKMKCSWRPRAVHRRMAEAEGKSRKAMATLGLKRLNLNKVWEKGYEAGEEEGELAENFFESILPQKETTEDKATKKKKLAEQQVQRRSLRVAVNDDRKKVSMESSSSESESSEDEKENESKQSEKAEKVTRKKIEKEEEILVPIEVSCKLKKFSETFQDLKEFLESEELDDFDIHILTEEEARENLMGVEPESISESDSEGSDDSDSDVEFSRLKKSRPSDFGKFRKSTLELLSKKYCDEDLDTLLDSVTHPETFNVFLAEENSIVAVAVVAHVEGRRTEDTSISTNSRVYPSKNKILTNWILHFYAAVSSLLETSLLKTITSEARSRGVVCVSSVVDLKNSIAQEQLIRNGFSMCYWKRFLDLAGSFSFDTDVVAPYVFPTTPGAWPSLFFSVGDVVRVRKETGKFKILQAVVTEIVMAKRKSTHSVILVSVIDDISLPPMARHVHCIEANLEHMETSAAESLEVHGHDKDCCKAVELIEAWKERHRVKIPSSFGPVRKVEASPSEPKSLKIKFTEAECISQASVN
eukprot:GHVP01026969.1.p1 GENE.GHVP01026969.1~~GHVP01026969.1.p1  ORF type:complete len:605 (-),score=150.43 GHVP01026969.1:175-1989(-)